MAGPRNGPHGKAAHEDAAASRGDHVGDGGAAVDDGAGAEEAGEEAEGDEGVEAGGEGAGSVCEDEAYVAGVVDDEAAVDFGERGEVLGGRSLTVVDRGVR